MAEANSWQFNKSALECHKYMLEHSIASDVTFVVSNKLGGLQGGSAHKETEVTKREMTQTFKAHRYQLISRSPVFHAMLCGDLAEKGDITVDDVDPRAFKEMLSYIYTDEVHIQPELAMPILYASKKYQIPGLTKLCGDYCTNQLSPDNACILYDHSLFFEESNLEEESLDIIKWKTQACLMAPSMSEVRQSTLSKILDCEIFTAGESDVFTACVKWATHQVKLSDKSVTGENLREVLGDCVQKIRYPTMDIIEFSMKVAPQEILQPSEEIAIFRYLGQKDKGVSPPLMFNGDSRFAKGPFIVQSAEGKTTINVNAVSNSFTVSCNSNIAVQSLLLGKVSPGQHRTAFDNLVQENQVNFPTLSLDGVNHEYSQPQVNTDPTKVLLATPMSFKKHSKHNLVIQIQERRQNIHSQPSTIAKVDCSEMTIRDAKTGVEVSVHATNKIMFLLGFEFNYS